MAFNYNPMTGAAGGALGAGLGQYLGGWKNPYEEMSPYYDQMRKYIEQYLGPYNQAGQRQIPGLEEEYGKLISDPGGFINKMGAGYQESPGFKFALQQALQGSGHAAAAGGMAGSPQHEFQNMGIATNMANQDYMNWLKTALGEYGLGLHGKEGMFRTGAEMGRGMGEDLASIAANEALMKYLAQAAENERSGGLWGNILGGLGTIGGGLIGGMFGGPAGAAVGSTVGGTIGGHFGR